MEPLTWVVLGVAIACIVLSLVVLSRIENLQLNVDAVRLDARDESDRVNGKITEVLDVVSNSISATTKAVGDRPSFDSLKALEDRITVAYQFAINERAEKIGEQVPPSVGLILATVLDSIVADSAAMKSSSATVAAVKRAADNLRTTSAIQSVPNTGMDSVEGQLLDGVLRGDSDAIRSFLNTPYAREALRGILGGSDPIL